MPGRILPEASHPPVGAWEEPRPLQILVVDDDILVRETLEQILCALHAGEVTQVGTGLDAIRLVGDSPERFDIIFCDLQMPGSDGLDVLAACAQAGLKGAVVLMSGSGEFNLRAAVAAAEGHSGALALTMAKPFSVAEVQSVLRRLTRFG